MEAWLSVAVSGGNQPFQMVEAVVDTEYTGWLMLPALDISKFGLTPIDTRFGMLPDGQGRETDCCEAVVLWHEDTEEILVDVMGSTPLIGTDLLAVCRLSIDWRDGGEVVIEESTPPEP